MAGVLEAGSHRAVRGVLEGEGRDRCQGAPGGEGDGDVVRGSCGGHLVRPQVSGPSPPSPVLHRGRSAGLPRSGDLAPQVRRPHPHRDRAADGADLVRSARERAEAGNPSPGDRGERHAVCTRRTFPRSMRTFASARGRVTMSSFFNAYFASIPANSGMSSRTWTMTRSFGAGGGIFFGGSASLWNTGAGGGVAARGIGAGTWIGAAACVVTAVAPNATSRACVRSPTSRSN